MKNYEFSDNRNLFDIPPQQFQITIKSIKFVMELSQKIVDSSDEINGFIIVIDEFQLIKNIKNPEAFFWLIRNFTQKQFNVEYIFTESLSKTSDIINMINDQKGSFEKD